MITRHTGLPASLMALIFSVGLAFALAGCRNDGTDTLPAPRVAPTLKDLGNFGRAVSTDSVEAQRFFDQGLTLLYGFNHAEAARSFKQAQLFDPQCAMAYWGEALALGPNINDKSPGPEREEAAYQAIQKARAKISGADPVERALIEALAVRYSEGRGQDRENLNRAYADAMAQVQSRYADDPEAAVLYAAAIMNTTPWDYWIDGKQPKPGTENLVPILEAMLQRWPDHPGGHHYYIHLVEASDDPDRAIPSADKLRDMIPGAGHLVHMPSHIYIRVGRYADASQANVLAIAADEDYLTQCRAQGIYPAAYYPHNIHFLWATRTLEGRSADAIRNARLIAEKLDKDKLREPGWAAVHLFHASPLFALVRFGHWDEILAEPAPDADLSFSTGIWHYARGTAQAALGRVTEAEHELVQLKALQALPQLVEERIWDGNSLSSILAIAAEVLPAEIALKRGQHQRSIQHLRRAVEMEDALIYGEPPDWHQPVRQILGAHLLAAGKAAEAEAVYREDLERFRDNGWSLFGLAQALEAQSKTKEAAQVRETLETKWASADITLAASRF